MTQDLEVHETAFISASAQLYGRIVIAAGASVWHNVVMRSECCEIRIGRITNVQDFVMVHVGYEHPTLVGDFCSIAHHATIHGCTIEDHCLIGINAVVMEGAQIGRGSIVAGGAVVPEDESFPPGDPRGHRGRRLMRRSILVLMVWVEAQRKLTGSQCVF